MPKIALHMHLHGLSVAKVGRIGEISFFCFIINKFLIMENKTNKVENLRKMKDLRVMKRFRVNSMANGQFYNKYLLTKIDSQRLCNVIATSFTWFATKEGWHFWNDVKVRS